MNRCSLTCVQPWIPSWFSPTSLDPCLLRHHILGSVLIRLPRSCLHSSPSCSSSSRTPCPHPRAPFRKQLQVLKQASLTSSPISLSSLSPHLLSIQLCWLCGVLSHPCLSVHTGPSVPEPGSSAPGHRRKVKGVSWLCLLLLQGVPVPSVFPQSSIIMLNK